MLDKVALLAEGVDRNRLVMMTVPLVKLSPSSRRAWIEIFAPLRKALHHAEVALLAEGVDRNNRFLIFFYRLFESPSSRRAWIEIERGEPL